MSAADDASDIEKRFHAFLDALLDLDEKEEVEAAVAAEAKKTISVFAERDEPTGYTILHMAVQRSSPAVVSAIPSHMTAALLSAESKAKGETALALILRELREKDQEWFVDHFEEYCAAACSIITAMDVSGLCLASTKGETPLHLAAYVGHPLLLSTICPRLPASEFSRVNPKNHSVAYLVLERCEKETVDILLPFLPDEVFKPSEDSVVTPLTAALVYHAIPALVPYLKRTRPEDLIVGANSPAATCILSLAVETTLPHFLDFYEHGKEHVTDRVVHLMAKAAAAKNRLTCLQWLVEKHGEEVLLMGDGTSEAVIMAAVVRGDLETVTWMVETCPEVLRATVADEEGNMTNLLHVAALSNNDNRHEVVPYVIKEMVEYEGCDVEMMMKGTEIPILHMALTAGNFHFFRELIELFPAVLGGTAYGGSTVLMMLIRSGRWAYVRSVAPICSKEVLEMKDDEGKTAHDLAKDANAPSDVVKLLKLSKHKHRPKH